ncbi:unnamed protein product [Prunus armeniaca]
MTKVPIPRVNSWSRGVTLDISNFRPLSSLTTTISPPSPTSDLSRVSPPPFRGNAGLEGSNPGLRHRAAVSCQLWLDDTVHLSFFRTGLSAESPSTDQAAPSSGVKRAVPGQPVPFKLVFLTFMCRVVPAHLIYWAVPC